MPAVEVERGSAGAMLVSGMGEATLVTGSGLGAGVSVTDERTGVLIEK
jgi:hypothetical protein